MSGFTHEQIELLLEEDCCHECEGYGEDKICVHIEAIAELPSRFGDFHIVAFSNNQDGKEHVAIIKGEVLGAEDVPVRLHSECLTGDVIGSLRCDCRDQLEAALKKIGEMETGVVLYLRQEGRLGVVAIDDRADRKVEREVPGRVLALADHHLIVERFAVARQDGNLQAVRVWVWREGFDLHSAGLVVAGVVWRSLAEYHTIRTSIITIEERRI